MASGDHPEPVQAVLSIWPRAAEGQISPQPPFETLAAMIALLCALHRTRRCASQKPLANFVKQTAGEQSIGHDLGRARRRRSQVRPWPYEYVGLIHNDPRPLIVQAQPSLCRGRNFHRVGVARRGMRHWNNGNDLVAFLIDTDHDHGAGPILDAFLLATQILGAPQIRVTDHKTRNRGRKSHA